MPRVLNIRHEKISTSDARVDRMTKWGNPFAMRHESTQERDRVCDAYERWIKQRPQLIEEAKNELRGKNLACWCAPKRCHAETLLRIANET